MSSIKNENAIPALLKGHGLPDFSQITPEQVEKYFPVLLEELNCEFNQIEESLTKENQKNQKPTWEAIMMPLYKIEERLKWSWGVINHLNGVKNSPELRKAHSYQQP